MAAYGGRAARTHARWFGRPFPFARLAVGTLAAMHPRVPKGLEVSLLAAVDVEEGGAYPLCARQSPAAGRARGQTPDGETAAVGLALLREALAAGAGELLGARWVAVDGGYSSRTFVEGVRELGLQTVGRLRWDAVLRHRYTGPHERRPGRRRPFEGRFDLCNPTRLTRTTPDDAPVDLYHGQLHSKAWQRWLRVVYVLPRGADPQTTRGVLLDGSDTELDPVRLFRFYRARFQIEFAFRDAKQHLGLQDCRARLQAKLDFHFNAVFAASSGPACRPGSGRTALWGPFPCTKSSSATSRPSSLNALPPSRPRADTPPMSRPGRRRTCGCPRPFGKQRLQGPEHGPPINPAPHFGPQKVSEP